MPGSEDAYNVYGNYYDRVFENPGILQTLVGFDVKHVPKLNYNRLTGGNVTGNAFRVTVKRTGNAHATRNDFERQYFKLVRSRIARVPSLNFNIENARLNDFILYT